jgi:hypothetical protein
MGFQTQVNNQQAPAVNGDFASANPRASIIGPEAGYIAGSVGATVGTFVWLDPSDSTGRSVISTGTGAPLGFLARTEQALITTYLAEFGNLVPAGYGVTVYGMGDYWATATVSVASLGQKAFAKLTDGTMQPGAAGATIVGYVETPFYITRAALVGELATITQ